MDFKKQREECQRTGFEPIRKDIIEIKKQLKSDETDKQIKEINKKLDEVLPTVREINNMRTAWTWTGRWFGLVVKFVVGIGIILGAIYSLKEWIRKS